MTTALRGRMRWWLGPGVWTIASALVVLLWGGVAGATLTKQGQASRARDNAHDGKPYAISKEDCEDTKDTFKLTLTAQPAEGVFEVWVSEGTDCSLNENRHGNNAQCTNVLSEAVTSKDINVKLTSADIANALQSVDNCTDTSASTKAHQVNLYFLLMNSGTDDADPSNVYKTPDGTLDITVDLVGPPAADDVTLTTTEGALTVTVENDYTGDLVGYYLYCDPHASGETVAAGSCSCINPGDTGSGGSGGSAGSTANGASAGSAGSAGSTANGGSAGSKTSSGAAGGGGSGGSTTSAGGSGGSTTSTGGTGGASGSGGSTSTGTMTDTTTSTTTTTTTTTTSTTTSTTGAGGSGGSATGGSAGTGGEVCQRSITEKTCVSCELPQGEDVPKKAVRCGTITGSSGTTDALTNGEVYAVAVAPYDELGNVGKLSVTRCATPQEVSDFFEEYNKAGGKGGGGCSVQPAWRRTNALAPLFGAVASMTLLLRRWRRRRSRASEKQQSGSPDGVSR